MGTIKIQFKTIDKRIQVDVKTNKVSLNEIHEGSKALLQMLAQQAETSVPFIIAQILQELEPDFLKTVGGQSQPQSDLEAMQAHEGKTEKELIEAGEITVVRGENTLVKEDDA